MAGHIAGSKEAVKEPQAAVAASRLQESANPRVAITVQNVSKLYPRRRWFGLRGVSGESARPALQDVSFTVREGEMVGLLGPNGAGKTTLLKSIASLLQVSSGRIFIWGRDVEADPIQARRLMGLVSCDERSFYWRLSGRQNLHFFASLYGVPRKSAESRIEVLLETLNLSAAASRPYYTYSTGMRQKLGIARGLLNDPAVILYDEPMRSLDPLSARDVRKWILANRHGSGSRTHLIATNQLYDAEQLCDRVLILNRGRVIADGPIQQIRERFENQGMVSHKLTYRGEPLNGRLGEPPPGLFAIAAESVEPGVITLRITASQDGRAFSDLLAEVIRMGATVLRCETEQVAFDEVFCSLLRDDSALPREEASRD